MYVYYTCLFLFQCVSVYESVRALLYRLSYIRGYNVSKAGSVSSRFQKKKIKNA